MAQGKLLNGTQLFEVSYVNHFKVECSGRSVLHSGDFLETLVMPTVHSQPESSAMSGSSSASVRPE